MGRSVAPDIRIFVLYRPWRAAMFTLFWRRTLSLSQAVVQCGTSCITYIYCIAWIYHCVDLFYCVDLLYCIDLLCSVYLLYCLGLLYCVRGIPPA